MQLKYRLIAALVVALVGSAIVMQGIGFAGPPSSATVNFGQENVGSLANNPNGLARGHDESGEAVDALVPRTAVISDGGSVEFITSGVHRVAVYAAGTSPDDIDETALVTLPPFGFPRFIDDGNALEIGGGGQNLTFSFSSPGK
ncbi:MAG: hypothetical protein O2821_12875, partial [Chloroflexi bacterium]|nr:hypothetical protein [Chloroflexota bacterium]